MAGFKNLPNELVIQIIWLTLPEDLESFTSTCRLIYDLARKSLDEHRAFKRKYRAWITHSYSPPTCLYGLLRAILKNPRIAWYVETLTVHELFAQWDSEAEDAEARSDDDDPAMYHRTGIMNADDEAMFSDAIEKCTYVSGDEYDDWWGGLDYGEDDPILGLLVTLLPNLKTLNLQFDPNDACRFFETIRRISAASSTSNSSIPLSRLSGVAVCLTRVLEHRPLINVGCLWSFFAIPSVRYVAGMGIRHNEMIPLPERSSNVISLNWLQPCDLTPEKIKNFFSIFKALQIFRLLPEGHPWSESDGDTRPMIEWDIQTIRDSLIKYANHSLEAFVLCIDDLNVGDQVFIGGFRAFEVLKQISINAILLLGKPGPFQKTLAEVLPMSIEKITIQDHRLIRQEYRSLVFNLLSNKHSSVPNLKSLSFRDSFFKRTVEITEYEDDDLKVACKNAGFILVISRKL